MVVRVSRVASIVGLALVMVMSGCSSEAPEVLETSTPTSSPSPTAIASAKSTPKPTSSPTPYQPMTKKVFFECNWTEPSTKIGEMPKFTQGTFKSVEEAWASGHVLKGCDASLSGAGVYSTDDLAAVAVAYPDDPRPDKVKHLWGICAATAHFYQTNGAINDKQRIEAAGALILCPDHPSAAIMANGSIEQQERNNGTRLGSGVYEVNSRIAPGTYRASGTIQNCYWERLDSAGEIIDNNFVSAATQVEVTVQESDFSVHFDGCGEFVKVD